MSVGVTQVVGDTNPSLEQPASRLHRVAEKSGAVCDGVTPFTQGIDRQWTGRLFQQRGEIARGGRELSHRSHTRYTDMATMIAYEAAREDALISWRSPCRGICIRPPPATTTLAQALELTTFVQKGW
jgi:hypothetical protein